MSKLPLKHQAYEAIKNNIIQCVYAPNTIITEEKIRDEIGASRTPIRDALSRLEQEGLIRILPKKGIFITELTIKEINTLYETRLLLEPYCVLHYGSRIPQETYLTYYQMFTAFLSDSEDTPYSYEEMDESFHSLFIENSQNSYFSNIYSTIESQISRTRVLTGKTSSRLDDTIEEHLAIVRAALKENWEEAAQAMVRHLQRSKDSYFDYLLEQNKGGV